MLCRCFEKEARKVLSMYELQTASFKCVAQLAAFLSCQPGAGRCKVGQNMRSISPASFLLEAFPNQQLQESYVLFYKKILPQVWESFVCLL